MILLLIALFLPSALLNSVAKRDFEDILPVQHIKEVKDGYIAKPDAQLDDKMAEEVTPTKCVPKESTATTGLPPQFQGGINAEYDVENEEVVKSLHLTKETRIFNDTNDYNVTEVIERVELKIVKPLCDD